MFQIKDQTFTQLLINDSGSDNPYIYQRDLSVETLQWRSYLRKKGYLCNDGDVNKYLVLFFQLLLY